MAWCDATRERDVPHAEQIVVRLECHPTLWRRVEQRGEFPRCIGRNSALSLDDLIEPIQRDLHAARGIRLREAGRLEELLQ